MGDRQDVGLSIFETSCFDSYVQGLGDWATIHAMCHDYRASSTIDLDEAREDLKQGRKIKCPLLVLWGEHGIINKCFSAIEEWKKVAHDGTQVDGYVIDSGHYIPEQRPEDIVNAIKDFLR